RRSSAKSAALRDHCDRYVYSSFLLPGCSYEVNSLRRLRSGFLVVDPARLCASRQPIDENSRSRQKKRTGNCDCTRRSFPTQGKSRKKEGRNSGAFYVAELCSVRGTDPGQASLRLRGRRRESSRPLVAARDAYAWPRPSRGIRAP